MRGLSQSLTMALVAPLYHTCMYLLVRFSSAMSFHSLCRPSYTVFSSTGSDDEFSGFICPLLSLRRTRQQVKQNNMTMIIYVCFLILVITVDALDKDTTPGEGQKTIHKQGWTPQPEWKGGSGYLMDLCCHYVVMLLVDTLSQHASYERVQVGGTLAKIRHDWSWRPLP